MPGGAGEGKYLYNFYSWWLLLFELWVSSGFYLCGTWSPYFWLTWRKLNLNTNPPTEYGWDSQCKYVSHLIYFLTIEYLVLRITFTIHLCNLLEWNKILRSKQSVTDQSLKYHLKAEFINEITSLIWK